MTGRLGHVPALDGIRGIAIAAVVSYHYFHLSGGFLGVDLFFVLSGFLITALLLEDGRLDLFYRRRAARLLPALAVLLLILSPSGWRLVLEGGFYAANLFRAFGHDRLDGTVFDHLWSLAEEEQFYLVWPAVLLLAGRNRRRLAIVLGGLFVVLVAYRFGLAVADASTRRLYFGPDTHADGLVLGCLAALVRPPVGAAVGRLGLGVVIAFFATASWTVHWLSVGLPVFEIAAVLVVLAAAESRLPELTPRPLVGLGLISYSLYLWHMPVHVAAPTHRLVGLAVAILFAICSYRFVEQPFRRRLRVQHAAEPSIPMPEAAG